METESLSARPTLPRRPAVAAVDYASWPRRAAAIAVDTAVLWAAFTALVSLFPVGALVALLLFPAYSTVAHGGRSGRTLGKAALGIAVRDERTFGPLGYTRAFVRWVVTFGLWIVIVVPGVLDAFSPLWSERRRAWHDRAAGSIVVRV